MGTAVQANYYNKFDLDGKALSALGKNSRLYDFKKALASPLKPP
jgi:hypothetical protein